MRTNAYGDQWASGPEWHGWQKREGHNAVEKTFGLYANNQIRCWISCIGQLNIDYDHESVCLYFRTPLAALTVALAMQTALGDSR